MKKTLQEKLEQRKIKRPGIFYLVLGFIWKVIFKKRYNVHYDFKIDVKKFKKQPFILISNHASRLDYIFTGFAFYPQRMNYVAGYNEFFRGHLQLVFKLLRVIPKRNFVSDIHTVKEILRIINKGGKICIFPEGMSSIGGGNQPCAIGGGKLLKHCKVPVLMTKIKGGYMMNTKYCLDERIGRVDVEVSQLFTVEDIERMRADELQMAMDRAIHHSDYEWNKEARVKFDGHGRIAHNLHHLLYWCPKCGKELVMKGEGNEIKCMHCGNGATINEYYDMIPFNDECVIPENQKVWWDQEREVVKKQILEEGFVLQEKVKLGMLPKYKYLKNKATSEIVGEGTLTLSRKEFKFEGTKNGEPFTLIVPSKNLPTFGMCTDVTFFTIYFEKEYYEFFPENEIVGKWLLTVEEIHRANGGNWKDFPEDLK